MNTKIIHRSSLGIFLVLGILALSFVLFACINGTSSSDVVSPDISVRNLPIDVSSIRLEISADDMDTITVSDIPASDTSYTVEVPAGVERTFTVTADNGSVTFYGSETTDLTAGESIDITIPLELSSTRIILPNYRNILENARIIQIDNMNGDGWRQMDGDDISGLLTSDFRPYDIDFDSQGRIYVAINEFTTYQVLRIDTFDDTTPDLIVSDSETSGGVQTITIDRVNNYIYYSTGFSPILRKSLGPPLGTQESFDMLVETGIASFRTTGFAVDDGILYIANDLDNTIIKYDPSRSEGSRVLATYTNEISTPWDVLVFGDEIVLSNLWGADGYKIMIFDKELNLLRHFGDYPTDDTNPQDLEFQGPRRFVAILNNKITIIDESDMAHDDVYNRLVSFNSTGSDWEAFMAGDIGKNPFSFFVSIAH